MHRRAARSDPGPADVAWQGRYRSTSVPRTPAVQLPRNLERPPFAETPPEVIRQTMPELVNVPTLYIAQMLRAQANELVYYITA